MRRKITRERLAEIIKEELLELAALEGRLIGTNIAKDIARSMNDLARAISLYDPKSLQGRGGKYSYVAEDLRAAWIALQSSFEEVFGDGLENTTAQLTTPLEECGMADEPMPLPGPPPEGGGALEPVFDDHEGRMAKSQLYKVAKYSSELVNNMNDQDQLPSWVQAKITKAADYLEAVNNYLEYERISPQK
jgi:hypothetical protein